MSTYSPWWRRLLQKHFKFLFKVCNTGNYHWFWDKECWCSVGINGRKEPEIL